MNKIITSLALVFVFTVISVNSLSAQRRYSGSRHTTSHGGHYSGGRGRSHKGGSYRHASTGNHYGRHKRY